MLLWKLSFAAWLIFLILWIVEQIKIKKNKTRLTEKSWMYLIFMAIANFIMHLSN